MAYDRSFYNKKKIFRGTTKFAKKYLQDAKKDKLIVSYMEIRELMTDKLYKILDLKKFEVRDTLNKLTFILRRRLDNCMQIVIDNFGVIMKRKLRAYSVKSRRTGLWFMYQGYRYMFRPHYNFSQYFKDDKIKKFVYSRGLRKAREHYRKYGKKKLY
jgi:hypothetical protein